MKFETMDDVLEWVRQLPVSQADTSPAILHLQASLPEDDFDKACAILAAQCWMPIETMRSSLTDEQIYGGSFLMFSSRNKIQKVSHGWDDEEEKTGIVWVYADGIQMINPTHWMFMPQPPKREK